MAENKTQPSSASVEKFIAGIENPRRRADALTALKIYTEVTGLKPVMWGPSIIGFGTHHYAYESGRKGTMPAASYSPRKASMTFYVGDKFEGAKELYARLGNHKKSVACLYINKLDDIDLQILRAIIIRDYARTCQGSHLYRPYRGRSDILEGQVVRAFGLRGATKQSNPGNLVYALHHSTVIAA